MRAAQLLTICVVISGCLQSSKADGDGLSPSACELLQIGSECVSLDSIKFSGKDCIESAFVVELPTAIYPLPRGFEDSGTATSPQRLAIAFARCQTFAVNGLMEADASIGYVGVIVTAPDRGQGDVYNAFDVEVLTDSPRLLQILRGSGFNAGNATITVQDNGPSRVVTVEGDVGYSGAGTFIPQEGSTIDPSEAHHGTIAWYAQDRSCLMHTGDGYMRVSASRGELTKATLAGGQLVGSGSQAILCDIRGEFHSVQS